MECEIKLKGKIIGENAVLADDGKEYFCSSVDLKSVNANIEDEVEFTPKGSRAVNFKIIQKGKFTQNLESKQPNSHTFNDTNFKKENFDFKKSNSFKNSQNQNPNKDDDDFWDGVDTEKSTKEYFENKMKNRTNTSFSKFILYFILIVFLLNFLTFIFGSVKIIKVFG